MVWDWLFGKCTSKFVQSADTHKKKKKELLCSWKSQLCAQQHCQKQQVAPEVAHLNVVSNHTLGCRTGVHPLEICHPVLKHKQCVLEVARLNKFKCVQTMLGAACKDNRASLQKTEAQMRHKVHWWFSCTVGYTTSRVAHCLELKRDTKVRGDRGTRFLRFLCFDQPLAVLNFQTGSLSTR